MLRKMLFSMLFFAEGSCGALPTKGPYPSLFGKGLGPTFPPKKTAFGRAALCREGQGPGQRVALAICHAAMVQGGVDPFLVGVPTERKIGRDREI